MITIRFKVRGADLEAIEAAVDTQLAAFGGGLWSYDLDIEAQRYGPPDVINEWLADVVATLTEAS
jgi:hypothetical protein